MDIAVELRRARTSARLTMNDLAKAVGVSVSTVSRIESGAADPKISIYRSLLAACGRDVKTSHRFRNSSAALAARVLLASDITEVPRDVEDKIAMFQRLGWVDGARSVMIPIVDFLLAAGSMSAISSRATTSTIDAGIGLAALTERLHGARVEFSVSGPEALVRLGSDEANISPVIYVADVAAARNALQVGDFEPMVTPVAGYLLPFDGISEVGSEDRVVPPIQAVIDGFCGTSRMPDMAEQVVDRWERANVAA